MFEVRTAIVCSSNFDSIMMRFSYLPRAQHKKAFFSAEVSGIVNFNLYNYGVFVDSPLALAGHLLCELIFE